MLWVYVGAPHFWKPPAENPKYPQFQGSSLLGKPEAAQAERQDVPF